ncbi:hypothetical protein RJ639_027368 [Escallonia herrerae]|uniref:Uncharacterized protein n=1 Tax=Escallonia herrerae TaxID=1293975 RepID=A0AA88X2M8_9ASTE|nr:hypothetical protein RJ639_027368 [Escallonia herrerae]
MATTHRPPHSSSRPTSRQGNNNQKFTEVDNENLVKEVDIIEGAFLYYGFNFYQICFENIVTGENSCLTRTTIPFDVKEKYVAYVSLIPIGTRPSYLEKFTMVENENLVREVDRVEGAFLDYGFNLFRIRFENIVTVEYLCLTRTTIMFDVKEEYVANVSQVPIETNMNIMKGIAAYLTAHN